VTTHLPRAVFENQEVNMTEHRPKFQFMGANEASYLAVGCRTCKAGVGQHCVTGTGRVRVFHRQRTRAVEEARFRDWCPA
jgi:hypothetical protein